VDSLIQVGPQTLEYGDNPDRSLAFTWQQVQGAGRPGAKVEIGYGEDEVRLPLDRLSDEWGLLRLLHGDTTSFTGDDSGRTFMARWLFEARDGQPYRLEAFVIASKSDNPFRLDLFTTLRVAESISPTTGGQQ
jgi:type VI protein secretion system component VasK